MKSRMIPNQIFKAILYYEAKEAEYGKRANNLRKEYAKLVTEFNINEKVIVFYKRDSKLFCYGIIKEYRWDTHSGMIYDVIPTTKTFTPHRKFKDIIRVTRSSIFKIEKYENN